MSAANWTGRCPRTANEAFGPYAKTEFAGNKPKRHISAILVALTITYVAAVVVIGLAMKGVL